MSGRQVFVTGMGIVCPIGHNVEGFTQALGGEASGLAPIALFDTSEFRVKTAGEILDLQKLIPSDPIASTMSPETERAAILGILAGNEALKSAVVGNGREHWAVVVGTASSEMSALEALYLRSNNSAAWERPVWGLSTPSLLVGKLASKLELRGGPTITIASACSAGTTAIGVAYDLIRNGDVDIALAGGVDPLSESGFAGFNSVRSLTSTRCQPFDRNRDGMFVSEGAAFLVLEERTAALRRHAPVRAEVMGHSFSVDAYHVTSPLPDGRGLAQAILGCLDAANLELEEIDYINAHGTGTAKNDPAELQAICRAFGDRARAIPISSIKGATGHALGACGAIEAIACIVGMENDFIPHTVGLDDPIEDFGDLDLVKGNPRHQRVGVAVSLSAAFGGLNAVLALRSVSVENSVRLKGTTEAVKPAKDSLQAN